MNVHNGVPASSQCCVYCWPAFVNASHWDDRGYTCCDECAGKADRVCQVPKFLFKTTFTPPRELP